MFNFFKTKIISNKILIAAGGTGGHIIPALVIADLFLQKDCQVLFVTDDRFDNYGKNFMQICRHKNFTIKYIKIPKHQNIHIQKIIRGCYAIVSIIKLSRLIFKHNIKTVLGFGSYVSLPSIIAGWLVGRKTFIHEQNSYMGLSNRISMFFVNLAMLSFSTTSGIPRLFKHKTVISGFPIRQEIKDLHYHNIIETINYNAFFTIHNLITIVVIGGSQGAKSFQDIIPMAISLMHPSVKEKIQIYHQTTKDDIQRTKDFYKKNNIKCFVDSFFINAPELMSKAHVVIARSGAGTIFEIITLGTPSILIPYPFATNDHQLKNALFMQNNGAAIVVEQQDLTSQKIADILIRLFNDPHDMAKLSHNAKQLASINSDVKIVRSIEIMVGKLGNDLPEKVKSANHLIETNVAIG